MVANLGVGTRICAVIAEGVWLFQTVPHAGHKLPCGEQIDTTWMSVKLSDAGMLVAQLIEDLIYSDMFDPRYADMVRSKAVVTVADF